MSYKVHLERLRYDNHVKGLDDFALVDDFFRYLLEETEILKTVDGINRINDIAQHYCMQGLDLEIDEDEVEEIDTTPSTTQKSTQPPSTISHPSQLGLPDPALFTTKVTKYTFDDIQKLAQTQKVSIVHIADDVKTVLQYSTEQPGGALPNSVNNGPTFYDHSNESERYNTSQNNANDNCDNDNYNYGGSIQHNPRYQTVPPTKRYGRIVPAQVSESDTQARSRPMIRSPQYEWAQTVTELFISFPISQLIATYLLNLPVNEENNHDIIGRVTEFCQSNSIPDNVCQMMVSLADTQQPQQTQANTAIDPIFNSFVNNFIKALHIEADIGTWTNKKSFLDHSSSQQQMLTITVDNKKLFKDYSTSAFNQSNVNTTLFSSPFAAKVELNSYCINDPEINDDFTNIKTDVMNTVHDIISYYNVDGIYFGDESTLRDFPAPNPIAKSQLSIDILKAKHHGIGWWPRVFQHETIEIDTTKIDEPLTTMDDLDGATKSLIASTLYNSISRGNTNDPQRQQQQQTNAQQHSEFACKYRQLGLIQAENPGVVDFSKVDLAQQNNFDFPNDDDDDNDVTH